MTLQVLPSWWKQILNASLGLVALWWVFRQLRLYVFFFPITLESIFQILLAEFNRQKNIRRVRSLAVKSAGDEEKGLSTDDTSVRTIASIVGYREEPTLFRKCLASYLDSPGLEIVLVGIDGDMDEDMQMVEIAEEVSTRYKFRYVN